MILGPGLLTGNGANIVHEKNGDNACRELVHVHNLCCTWSYTCSLCGTKFVYTSSAV